jgi:hypothetical protein
MTMTTKTKPRTKAQIEADIAERIRERRERTQQRQTPVTNEDLAALEAVLVEGWQDILDNTSGPDRKPDRSSRAPSAASAADEGKARQEYDLAGGQQAIGVDWPSYLRSWQVTHQGGFIGLHPAPLDADQPSTDRSNVERFKKEFLAAGGAAEIGVTEDAYVRSRQTTEGGGFVR